MIVSLAPFSVAAANPGFEGDYYPDSNQILLPGPAGTVRLRE
jgi:hypothetical protein